jgi:hypothetical protein
MGPTEQESYLQQPDPSCCGLSVQCLLFAGRVSDVGSCLWGTG